MIFYFAINIAIQPFNKWFIVHFNVVITFFFLQYLSTVITSLIKTFYIITPLFYCIAIHFLVINQPPRIKLITAAVCLHI